MFLDVTSDWLVDRITANVTLQQLSPTSVRLSNTLLAREFSTSPDWATTDLYSAAHGSALRAISPEAIVSLDDTEYNIGGLVAVESDSVTPCPVPSGVGPPGQCPVAYLNRSQLYAANDSAFHYVGHSTTSRLDTPFPWTPGARHTRTDAAWP
jgi:hypothetical protein